MHVLLLPDSHTRMPIQASFALRSTRLLHASHCKLAYQKYAAMRKYNRLAGNYMIYFAAVSRD
jgi:hypothetical protein